MSETLAGNPSGHGALLQDWRGQVETQTGHRPSSTSMFLTPKGEKGMVGLPSPHEASLKPGMLIREELTHSKNRRQAGRLTSKTRLRTPVSLEDWRHDDFNRTAKSPDDVSA